MHDTIETINGSLIQHGPVSDRIYLMKASLQHAGSLPENLYELATRKGYTKIFVKIPERLKPLFARAGYEEEANIPGYYNGSETCRLMSLFLSEKRAIPSNGELMEQVLHAALDTRVLKGAPDTIPEGHVLRMMTPGDAEEMSRIYRKVFASYPFPIHDPEYLVKTMSSHVMYFGVVMDSKLIALASCEMDLNASAVEMTDFATLPESRGKGLAVKLLYQMEQAMREQGLTTAFTIARAVSFGMNITFAKLGYQYTGTLVNNTQISGSMESMNVWYKPILKL